MRGCGRAVRAMATSLVGGVPHPVSAAPRAGERVGGRTGIGGFFSIRISPPTRPNAGSADIRNGMGHPADIRNGMGHPAEAAIPGKGVDIGVDLEPIPISGWKWASGGAYSHAESDS